jgi:hypothetical protein
MLNCKRAYRNNINFSNNITSVSIILILKYMYYFLEFASLIGILLYSIWSRLWLSIKALVV